jgi:tetrahydromethanopterin S-methyltransferase subunit G
MAEPDLVFVLPLELATLKKRIDELEQKLRTLTADVRDLEDSKR